MVVPPPVVLPPLLTVPNAVLNADAGEAYYATYIGVIEERLAVAGVRLAQLLNRILPVAPRVR